MKRILNHFFSLLFFTGLFLSTSVFANYTLDGRYVQGGLLVGKTLPGAQVKLDGMTIQVSDQGFFVIGFDRDHGAESRLQMTYPDGRIEKKILKIAKREYDIQRIDNLPKRKVTPEKMDLVRIRKESALVKKARNRDDPRTDYLSGWQWPVKGRISGVYGSQRILNGKPRRPHFGVDVAAPTGTLVRSPADGIVTLAHPDMFFSGGTLILDHGQHLSSSFLHLSKILVKKGDRIKQGDPIAHVGATGRVTGPHLDWRMNFHKFQIDPQLLVPPMEE
ncbi:M23 family metallopeptidase [Sedimenticola selenatireducens]|uniref:M23 family metallopeptidase n=1 Tax=Sedimenticola selenatireducens TaxID=191960 RepID=A0A558DKL2_9GAMM|nr:M23 family metallopeptidase [Sedimenticola selenatireducens]TVO71258.1 M23 family metallopeptidase [Sedimenticola selenatireducens]TVT61560.1 MAG: M23 family metallopeptidase [Sedimenticola selenatireducens]